MKRLLITLLALFLAFASFFAVGCGGDTDEEGNNIPITDTNSYIVSFYKRERLQDDYGEIFYSDLVFWRAERVIKSQMIKLDKVGGKYKYSELNTFGQIKYEGTDGDWFRPSDDGIFLVDESNSKTIKFIFRGENVYEFLTSEEKKYYNENFVDVYTEEFKFNLDMIKVLKRLSGMETIQYIELNTIMGYQNDKPFVHKISYSPNFDVSSFTFKLIRSTDVYVEIR